MLSRLFVVALTVLSIAVGAPQMTPAWGFLYAGAVGLLAVGYLVFDMVERDASKSEHEKEVRVLTRLGSDANTKLDLLVSQMAELAKTKNIPETDPQYQEVRRIAESAASSIAEMNAWAAGSWKPGVWAPGIWGQKKGEPLE